MKALVMMAVVFSLVLGVTPGAWADKEEVIPMPYAFIYADGSVFPLDVVRNVAVGATNGEPIPTWIIPEQAFETNEYQITIGGSSKWDPAMNSALGVIDFGAPTTFGFFFATPIAPVAGPNVVAASIVGGLTDFSGNGVSLTWAPHLNLPSAFVLATAVAPVPPAWVGAGVDVGAGFFAGPGLPGAFYNYGAFAAGPVAGPVGPWAWLAHEYFFTLSGGSDSAALTAYSSINPVPEPLTLILLGLGLGGLTLTRREK